MLTISIRNVVGGYVITDDIGKEEVATTLEKVFKNLLLNFEGRSENYSANNYGAVYIIREKQEPRPTKPT